MGLVERLRCWNALRRIQNELLSLYDLENQLQCSAQDAVILSDPPRVQRKIDRRLVIIGFKGGLVSPVAPAILRIDRPA